MARLNIVQPFSLITDDHRRFEFAAGEQEIPGELADHWYVKAHCEPEYHAPVVVEEPAVAETPDEPAPVAEARKLGRPKKS